ncbi:MAG: hypothetical protein WBA59_03695 [Moheibacter sp.]
MKVRAQYNYAIVEKYNQKHVLIEDKNMGEMSVTNDIENVVDEICQTNKINPENAVSLYRDSEGVWDGYDRKTDRFIYLGANNSQSAIEKFYDLQR